MGGWVRYLTLTATVRTGLSLQVFVWGIVAALATAATLSFLSVAAYLWIAQRYDGIIAGIVLGGFFLLVAIIAGLVCVVARHRAIERARQEMASRSPFPFFDSTFLGLGLQIGRTMEWRRLVPLAAVALLVAGLAKEWSGGAKPSDEERHGEK